MNVKCQKRVKCKNEGRGGDLETLKIVASNEFIVSSKNLSPPQQFILLFIYLLEIQKFYYISVLYLEKKLHAYNSQNFNCF